MNRRSVHFGYGPYRGWTLTLDQGARTGSVLVQIRTGPRSVNGSMFCAMVLRSGTDAWRAAVAGIDAGPGSPLDDTLTAILADLPEHAAAYRANPLQRAHIGLISAAGAHARRDSATHEYDRPTATAVLPRPNPRPHNEHGTTDDFYG